MTARTDALDRAVASLRDDLDAAQARNDATIADGIAAAAAPLEERVADSLAATEAQVTALAAAVEALSERVVEVEKMPIDASAAAEAAVAAYRRELAELRARIDEVIDRNTALQDQIDEGRAEEQAAERAAAARAALDQIAAALANGGAYDAALGTVSEAGAEVPAALADHAETGVPTNAALVARFAPAARAALEAALRDVSGMGTADRLWAFVRAQLGARSLAARDGDDADAILSRAEAALRAGDLDTALAEVDTLPESARQHMDGWVADAHIRRDALAALPALSAEIDNL
jgi:hypothetical protein